MRCKLELREKKHSSVNKCSIPCAYYYRTEVRSCQEVQNICFIFNYLTVQSAFSLTQNFICDIIVKKEGLK